MNKLLLILFFICFFSTVLAQSGRSLKLLKAGKFEEALTLAKEQKNKEKEPIKFHHFIARAYVLLGDDIKAETEFQHALRLIDLKEKSHQLILTDFDVMDELSLLYVRTGNWNKARGLISRSLNSRVKKWNKKDPTNYRPYLPLGLFYYQRGQPDSASFFLEKYAKNLRNSNYTNYLDIDKYADTYQILADIALQQNKLVVAKKLAQKSLRLQKHVWTKRQTGRNYPDQIRALNALTTINFKIKKTKRAQKFNNNAIRLFEKHVQRHELLQAQIYLNKAQIEFVIKNDSSTIQLLKKAMKLQIQYVKNTFVFLSEYEKENAHQNFNIINERILRLSSKVLLKQGDSNNPFTGDLLNFVINTKAIILNESNKLIVLAANEKSQIYQQLMKWKELKNQWLFLNTASKKVNQNKSSEILNKIIALEKQLISRLNVTDQLEWSEITKNLAESEIALEIVDVSEHDSITSFLTLSISNKSTIPDWEITSIALTKEKYASYYRNSIKFGIQDTITHTLFTLPEKATKVYISPTSVLHHVNFNTIQNSKSQFLSESFEIVNLSNISSLCKKVTNENKYKSAVLIGLSDFTSITEVTYPNLPGVKDEINQLNEFLISNEIIPTVLLDEDNIISRLKKLSNFEILHIASHGYHDKNNTLPMLASGLILTSDSSVNQLTAYEASLLNLENTNLVVLSACGSGLGEVNGEGIYGLQRAFEVAGVSNMIMSLWEIDDEFTQYFMITFYSYLIELNSISSAFSKTLNKVKLENSDPKYWGAFKLVQFF